MPLRRLARHAREAWEVPRDLLLRRYPPFVTGGPLPRGDVPVFVFHSLEPESFGAKLRHLAENGYVTLSAEAYFRLLVGVGQVPDRAVVLTFDDGRGSLWSVGFPLMRRYGMKGIVFLVPGRVPEGAPGPTLDDVEDRRLPDEVLAPENGPGAFLNWGEVEAMAASGLFDFESHSLSHSRIHTGPRLAGFVTPRLRSGYDAFDLPLIHGDGRDLQGPDVPLGTPLFTSDSRLSDALRFFEDPGVRRACVEAVGGEESFFRARDWQTRLRGLVAGKTVTGRLESEAERNASIAHELRESKRLIEARVRKPVSHLCYPWHVSGESARRLAREAGYRTAFCGKVRGVPISRPGSDPLKIARLGEDYLELLPGRGREQLSVVLQRKWRRRLRGRP
ncbi:MAG TPA: polysaccharide deacetylase family protein [Vicinamibacteria bacterium]|nr:polysaccharide deacetylase family protein [Vicinamibacteria bacterium]